MGAWRNPTSGGGREWIVPVRYTSQSYLKAGKEAGTGASRSAFGRTRRTVRTKPHTPRCPRSRAYRTAVRVRRRAIYVINCNPGRFIRFRLCSRVLCFSFWLRGARCRRAIRCVNDGVARYLCHNRARRDGILRDLLSRLASVLRLAPTKTNTDRERASHPRLFTRTVPSLPCVPCTLPPEARITIAQALPTAGCYRPTLRHLRLLGCSVARCAPRRSLVLEHDPSCRLILRP